MKEEEIKRLKRELKKKEAKINRLGNWLIVWVVLTFVVIILAKMGFFG